MYTKKKEPPMATPLTNSKIHKIPFQKSFAVKELERLANEAARKKNPTIPAEWLVPRKYSDNTTSGLTKCVYDFLKIKGHHVERTGNEGRVIDNRKTFTDVVGRQRTIGKVTRIKSSGTRGTSDLKSSINGRFIAIEIKCQATNDRIRPEQLDYKEKVEKAGGIYLTVITFQKFYNWYQLNFGRAGNE